MKNLSLNSIEIESWFIPCDIIMILCTSLVILFASCFLFIIIFDQTCHTNSMIFTMNSCLCSFVAGCSMLSLAIFTYQNDRQQIEYEDSLCLFRAYLTYISPGLLKYSFLLQAFYRYVTMIYRYHSFWKSKKFLATAICLTWIFNLIYPFVYLFSNKIVYNVDNQVCQIPLGFSLPLIYTAICIYIMPVSMTMIIYMKLVRYVHRINTQTTLIFTIHRLHKALMMVRRIVVLNMMLSILGFPYMLFVFMSFFTSTPRYHFRIAFLSIDGSFVVMMIVLFLFTNPLKNSIIKRIEQRLNRVEPY